MITYAWYLEDSDGNDLSQGAGEISLATSALEVIRDEVAVAFDHLRGKDAMRWSTISITLARKG